MPSLDQGLKRLIQVDPQRFVQRLFPGGIVQGPLATDVAMEPQHILDTLYAGTINNDPCLFIIEEQTSLDQDDLPRFHDYASRAEGLYHRPAMLIILWFLKDRRPPSSPFTMEAGGFRSVMRFFYSLDVYQLQAHVILQEGITTLLPLVPLMQGADTTVDETVMQTIADEADDDVRQTLALLAAVFIARVRGTEWAQTLLKRWFHMISQLIEESPLYQEWMAEAKAKGEAEGRAKGEAEGRAEGRAKGEAEGLGEALELVMTTRFGSLDADVLATIRQASVTTLRAAITAATNAELEQVRAILGVSTTEG